MLRPHSIIFAVLAAGAVVLGTACQSSTTAPLVRPVTEGVVDQPGEHITRYRGPELEVLVSSRYAATRIGDEWLILQLGIGGMESAATEVRRDRVWLRTPNGQRLPIMPHQEFSSRYDEIAGPARGAAIAAEPLDISRGGRRDCTLDFMPLPGTGIVREARHVNHRELCQGWLYFAVPGGVQAGRYVLIVELEEREVELPFTLS